MILAGIGFLLGLLCGCLAGWLRSRAVSRLALRMAEARAAAATGENNALRSELERRKHEIGELHRAIRDAEMALTGPS